MKPETHIFQADEDMPNNQWLPVLIYRGAAKSSDLALFFEETFKKHGWAGTWRDSVFDYHHFHSNAHEALGIAGGHARLMLGGESGGTFDVEAGDLIVLPAGTGHKKINASGDFLVIGAYPKGQENYDICKKSAPDLITRIENTALPETNPLSGEKGPWLIS